MSLVSRIFVTTDLALPAGGMADVAGLSMNVRVEEDEMLLFLEFEGTVKSGGAGVLELDISWNGNTTPTPLAAQTLAASGTFSHWSVSHLVLLAKGQHVIRLRANDVGSQGHTIDGVAYHAHLRVKRESSDATLAHGVDSKVQNIF